MAELQLPANRSGMWPGQDPDTLAILKGCCNLRERLAASAHLPTSHDRPGIVFPDQQGQSFFDKVERERSNNPLQKGRIT